MEFIKENLKAVNNYNWTDEMVFSGTPSRRIFDRHNGNQLLFIINSFAAETGAIPEEMVSKLEDLLINQLPLEVKSEISVLKWLKEHQQ